MRKPHQVGDLLLDRGKVRAGKQVNLPAGAVALIGESKELTDLRHGEA